MSRAPALRAAIALYREPTRVRLARQQALPDGVPFLLRLVSRDEGAIAQAVELSGRPPGFVVAAAAFFVEQILFAPNADSYRALGVGPDASREKLRGHMIMLLKWLHPDAAPDEAQAMLALRVTRAWNNLKTEERRAAYDTGRRGAGAPGREPAESRPPPRSRASSVPAGRSPSGPARPGLLSFILGFIHGRPRGI